MKLLLIFAAVVAVALAETCQNTGDCGITSCSNTHTLQCSQDGECVCVTGSQGSGCQSQRDCQMDCSQHGHHGPQHNVHCVDGNCRCGFGPMVGPMGGHA